MKLLTCHGEPRLEDVDFTTGHPRYAILSHTWLADNQEVTYAEIVNQNVDRSKAGWTKVSEARREAAKRGHHYIWIDTCCIDKSSSAELSEAINSMYRYYHGTDLCLVYLADFTIDDESSLDIIACRWFTRGWTLQEMLAPKPWKVQFVDSHWQPIGWLHEMAEQISVITGVHADLLRDTDPRTIALAKYSVAQKMSWAALRSTRRLEDVAYSLLGLFSINLPIVYGEGVKAFRRLQEAILRDNPHDQTILLWHRDETVLEPRHRPLLAPSPRHFAPCGDIIPMETYPGSCETGEAIEVVSSGIRLRAPIIKAPKNFVAELHAPCLALLKCQSINDRAVKAHGLELVRSTSSSHWIAKQSHLVDAYAVAKYSLRATPVDIDFLYHSSQMDASMTRLQCTYDTAISVHRILLRWVGKESRGIVLTKPTESWDAESGSFKVDIGSHLSTFTGKFVAYHTILGNKPVWVRFAVQLVPGDPKSLRIALRIVFEHEKEFSDAFDLLADPWLADTTLEEQKEVDSDYNGDKIGDFTLAHTARRMTWDRLLYVRVVPAMLSTQKHLVIELSVVSTMTGLLGRYLYHQLQSLPILALDIARMARSNTPNELLELADDTDRVLMHNQQYADRNELTIAIDTGWYYKHDSNPKLWRTLRQRRYGRPENETWDSTVLRRLPIPFRWIRGMRRPWRELLEHIWHAVKTLSIMEYLIVALIFKSDYIVPSALLAVLLHMV